MKSHLEQIKSSMDAIEQAINEAPKDCADQILEQSKITLDWVRRNCDRLIEFMQDEKLDDICMMAEEEERIMEEEKNE